jgi:hypothetical protein
MIFFSCSIYDVQIMTAKVPNYKCKKIQSTEIFALLAWWCQQEKELPHITYFIYTIPALSSASERSFSTAGFSTDTTATNPGKLVSIFLNSNLPKWRSRYKYLSSFTGLGAVLSLINDN